MIKKYFNAILLSAVVVATTILPVSGSAAPARVIKKEVEVCMRTAMTKQKAVLKIARETYAMAIVASKTKKGRGTLKLARSNYTKALHEAKKIFDIDRHACKTSRANGQMPAAATPDCNSPESCMPFCSKPANAETCKRIFQQFSGSRQERMPFSPTGSDVRVPRKAWNAPSEGTGGGILYAENLPACQGTELFHSPIAVDGTYDYISPLGQTSAPGHVIPVDHLYFNFKRTAPGDNTSQSLPATILSPGDVEIFQINSIAYEQDSKIIGTDYHIYFAPCREVTVYLGHVTALNAKLQNAIDHADQKSCGAPFSTGSPPNTLLKPCSYSMLLHLKSGEEIGTAGGPDAKWFWYLQAFDFGVHDQRMQSLPFIDPKYWTLQNLHTVCGLYYYPEGQVKSNLLNTVKNTKKDANGFPDCGTNMWDKAHTAEGNWVLPNTPTGPVPDMQGLAAIHLNTDTGQGVIDWGSGIAPAGKIQFPIGGSGVINRDPADVTADGTVYCFQDASAGSRYVQYTRSVLLQLVDDNTLKAEYLVGVCPIAPSFTHPTEYNR